MSKYQSKTELIAKMRSQQSQLQRDFEPRVSYSKGGSKKYAYSKYVNSSSSDDDDDDDMEINYKYASKIKAHKSDKKHGHKHVESSDDEEFEQPKRYAMKQKSHKSSSKKMKENEKRASNVSNIYKKTKAYSSKIQDSDSESDSSSGGEAYKKYAKKYGKKNFDFKNKDDSDEESASNSSSDDDEEFINKIRAKAKMNQKGKKAKEVPQKKQSKKSHSSKKKYNFSDSDDDEDEESSSSGPLSPSANSKIVISQIVNSSRFGSSIDSRSALLNMITDSDSDSESSDDISNYRIPSLTGKKDKHATKHHNSSFINMSSSKGKASKASKKNKQIAFQGLSESSDTEDLFGSSDDDDIQLNMPNRVQLLGKKSSRQIEKQEKPEKMKKSKQMKQFKQNDYTFKQQEKEDKFSSSKMIGKNQKKEQSKNKKVQDFDSNSDDSDELIRRVNEQIAKSRLERFNQSKSEEDSKDGSSLAGTPDIDSIKDSPKRIKTRRSSKHSSRHSSTPSSPIPDSEPSDFDDSPSSGKSTSSGSSPAQRPFNSTITYKARSKAYQDYKKSMNLDDNSNVDEEEASGEDDIKDQMPEQRQVYTSNKKASYNTKQKPSKYTNFSDDSDEDASDDSDDKDLSKYSLGLPKPHTPEWDEWIKKQVADIGFSSDDSDDKDEVPADRVKVATNTQIKKQRANNISSLSMSD